jgi:uncharacterized protein YjiS (DUF1127 family)
MKTATFDAGQVADVRRESGVAEVIRKTSQALSHWNKRRQAIRELSGLSDRQLADIGLRRADIPSTVEKLLK